MTFVGYVKHSVFRTKSLMTAIQNSRMSTDVEDPVILESVGTAGLVTLNRPKRLNAMNYNIWKRLLPCLLEWQKSHTHLIIKGSGRAFCAGGDIRWYHLENDSTKNAFKVAMNNGVYLLSKYEIPYIALIDGIAFGAGLALAAHGRYRIATERTKVAFPEARLGWLPDVSATYILPRLSQHLGFYLALTGQRLEGKDVVLAGLATHFVPRAHFQELEAKLSNCSVEDIEPLLNSFSESPGKFFLDDVKGDIDYCFSAETVEEIIERLSKFNNSWSSSTLDMLNLVCPVMLKVGLRALQLGNINDIKECIRVENRVLSRCIGSYNTQEAVKALLLKKNPPKWQPSSIAEVTDSMVDSYFDPLPIEEEISFFDD